MKKLLIVLLVIVAVYGAYTFLFKPSTNNSQLAFVPADTPVFSAQLEPIDLRNYMASLGIFPEQIDQLKAIIAEASKNKLGAESAQTPVKVFLMQLFEDYFAAMSTPEEITQKTGFKNELRSLFYMVGMSPVLQVELGDPEAFLAMFSRAQKQSGITHTEKTIDGNVYQSYLLDEVDNIELLVRLRGDWGVVTIHAPRFDETHLTTSLAITQPEENLIDSGILEKMQDEYRLNSGALGFISSQQIALAFTTLDGNSLASDVNLIFGEQIGTELDIARTPECKTEIDMLTAMWPGVFLSTDVHTSDAGDFNMDFTYLIPTASQTAISSLQDMRGYLPAYSTGDFSGSFLKAGLGLDVANLSRSVNKMWTAMVNLDLSCEALVKAQQEIKQNNPTGAFAMAGIANGFLGVATAVNKIDLAKMQEGNMEIDAVVGVSAEDVRTLYSSVQTFAPMLSAITLPNDGETLSVNEVFPMLDQFGIQLTAMASEGQLVLFTGDIARQQALQTLSNEPVKNGLFAFGMNYNEFFKQLVPLMAMSGQTVPPELQSMMNTNMAVSVTTDVTEVGIEIKGAMQIKK